MFIPCRPVGARGGGTQILADQLNLSQPGGEGYAHQIIIGTPGFLRPPCGPAILQIMVLSEDS